MYMYILAFSCYLIVLCEGIYLTCTMAITTLAMILTVLVLNLYHSSDRPVPNWATNVIFIGLARLMGKLRADPFDISNFPLEQLRKKYW